MVSQVPREASTAAAQRKSSRAPSRRSDSEIDGDRTGLEPAARGRSAGSGCDAVDESQVGNKRKRAAAAAAETGSDDDAVHEQQVADDPPEGAMRLRSQLPRHPQRASVLFTPLSLCVLFFTGAPARPLAGLEQLQELARRIKTCKEGTHAPSGEPRLLYELTDKVLVVLSDAVAAVAAELPALSANAALRLLAWTTADARGATVALDKPLALTVGKRLDRQAQSVREKIAGIRARAAQAERVLQLETIEESRLELKLKLLKDDLKLELTEADEEVYVGFNELESLLPEAEVDESPAEAPAAAEVEVSPIVAASLSYADKLAKSYERHNAWRREAETYHQQTKDIYAQAATLIEEGEDMPRHLIERIGVTATWKLNDIVTRAGVKIGGALWWTSALPLLVKSMVSELAAERRRHDYIRSCQEELLSNYRELLAAKDQVLEEAAGELEQLRAQLREAAGREAGLKGAIALLRTS